MSQVTGKRYHLPQLRKEKMFLMFSLDDVLRWRSHLDAVRALHRKLAFISKDISA